jgi:hypothetical protein
VVRVSRVDVRWEPAKRVISTPLSVSAILTIGRGEGVGDWRSGKRNEDVDVPEEVEDEVDEDVLEELGEEVAEAMLLEDDIGVWVSLEDWDILDDDVALTIELNDAIDEGLKEELMLAEDEALEVLLNVKLELPVTLGLTVVVTEMLELPVMLWEIVTLDDALGDIEDEELDEPFGETVGEPLEEVVILGDADALTDALDEAWDDEVAVTLVEAVGVGGGYFNKITSLLVSALLKTRISLIDPLYNSRLLSDLPFQPRRIVDEVVEEEMANIEVDDEENEDPST